jgi:MinD-like ATPase involved in chromosome partitioning or flagellar assembly
MVEDIIFFIINHSERVKELKSDIVKKVLEDGIEPETIASQINAENSKALKESIISQVVSSLSNNIRADSDDQSILKEILAKNKTFQDTISDYIKTIKPIKHAKQEDLEVFQSNIVKGLINKEMDSQIVEEAIKKEKTDPKSQIKELEKNVILKLIPQLNDEYIDTILDDKASKTLGRKIINNVIKKVEPKEYADEVNKQIQNIIDPNVVVEFFINSTIEYVQSKGIPVQNPDSPEMKCINQMKELIGALKTDETKHFKREVTILCLLFGKIDKNEVDFKNYLMDAFYSLLENKINLSKPKDMIESFVQDKVLRFLDSGVADNKLKQQVYSTFGLKPIEVETGRTLFNWAFHTELGTENKTKYPRNIITGLRSPGYIIEWSKTVVRKAGVIVNYR